MQYKRQSAWNLIDNAIKEFDVIAKNWTVPSNVNRLKEIKLELETFKPSNKKFKIFHIQITTLLHINHYLLLPHKSKV